MSNTITRRAALTGSVAGAAAIVAGTGPAIAVDHDRAEWLALWRDFLDKETLACDASARDFREELLEMADLWEDLAGDHEGTSNHPAAEAIKAFYDYVARQPMPPKFLELLSQLEEEAAPTKH